MSSEPYIKAEDCTQELFQACNDMYPALLQVVYKETRPKSRLETILKDDKWRYYELPGSLEVSQGLTKEQLARLVQWKITHGVHRPFLPGMVQKNPEDEVKEQTSKAAKVLNQTSDEQDFNTRIISALDIVCKLKGVGPATGSLVLSVLSPRVPFFEDELFYWLNQEHSTKLKYDKKEYKMLLDCVLELERDNKVTADVLEKTAYVLMHEGQLTDQQKKQLDHAIKVPAQGEDAEPKASQLEPPAKQVNSEAEPGSRKIESDAAATKTRKTRTAETYGKDSSDLRRSKRRKA
ncbi:hypothetical protein LTR64_006564 [Lithohypha guttulata]|uniref:Uncharacterized protein n=1 Tax=Lithohypha guttulata TaxID=1690604 RepID=A0AAN7YAQ8_9EURO|nr:hypothetical protein LTR51_004878 [Lithohypha guttulata]KAK5091485.1 hypothetical protein LTR05_001669 [Lithohypha guttulata]